MAESKYCPGKRFKKDNQPSENDNFEGNGCGRGKRLSGVCGWQGLIMQGSIHFSKMNHGLSMID